MGVFTTRLEDQAREEFDSRIKSYPKSFGMLKPQDNIKDASLVGLAKKVGPVYTYDSCDHNERLLLAYSLLRQSGYPSYATTALEAHYDNNGYHTSSLFNKARKQMKRDTAKRRKKVSKLSFPSQEDPLDYLRPFLNAYDFELCLTYHDPDVYGEGPSSLIKSLVYAYPRGLFDVAVGISGTGLHLDDINDFDPRQRKLEDLNLVGERVEVDDITLNLSFEGRGDEYGDVCIAKDEGDYYIDVLDVANDADEIGLGVDSDYRLAMDYMLAKVLGRSLDVQAQDKVDEVLSYFLSGGELEKVARLVSRSKLTCPELWASMPRLNLGALRLPTPGNMDQGALFNTLNWLGDTFLRTRVMSEEEVLSLVENMAMSPLIRHGQTSERHMDEIIDSL